MKFLVVEDIVDIVKAKPSLRPLNDTEIEWFVDSAIRKALNLKYPFDLDKEIKDIDNAFFKRWVIDASVTMIESIGVGNIKSYSENGLSISYAEMVDGLPKALIAEIMPSVGTAL